LQFLSKLAHDSQRLDNMKPQSVTHEVQAGWNHKKQQVQATSQRFQTRIRGKDQCVRVEVKNSEGTFIVSGQTTKAAGKSSAVDTGSDLGGKDIQTIITMGRGDPTLAETKRALLVLHMLQGVRPILDNPWMQSIWHTSESVDWPEAYTPSPAALAVIPIQLHPDYPINSSQNAAIEHMLSASPNSRISLVHGPPGTGKTTVIATCVVSAISAGQKGIWLMAQSNVAVKNIAEKLAKLGFYKWRLVVSQEFVFDWHEHLYHQLLPNIIRSNELPKNAQALHKALDGAQVILCTLSMLSNPRLRDLGITRAVPVTKVIIDEASQIEVGDYVSLFSQFQTVRKVCFIGDDKQLPPFGQEDLGNLESIFEMEHLRNSALFLDTQYRMPPQIGDFISKEVYDNLLHSNPLHPITSSTAACRFVDVSKGIEQHHGTSWKVYTNIHRSSHCLY
ncbi:P-loop containing nucleoside triphosphate hydrolase protein, partial [Artomyces pyxidatus]